MVLFALAALWIVALGAFAALLATGTVIAASWARWPALSLTARRWSPGAGQTG